MNHQEFITHFISKVNLLNQNDIQTFVNKNKPKLIEIFENQSNLNLKEVAFLLFKIDYKSYF